MASFGVTRKLGVQWVECDVALLGDGTPVLFHDQTFERTTNGSGALSDRDLAYAQGLDAGSWFGDTFASEPVPTLEQALDAFDRLGLCANLELKIHGDEGPELAATVADILQKRRQIRKRLLISSFDHNCLALVRQRIPELEIALIYPEIGSGWKQAAENLGATGIIAGHKQITVAQIKTVREAGLFCGIYTVNDPTEIETLWDPGLNSVITDTPRAFDRRWFGEMRA